MDWGILPMTSSRNVCLTSVWVFIDTLSHLILTAALGSRGIRVDLHGSVAFYYLRNMA